jgi:hypothetical protein
MKSKFYYFAGVFGSIELDNLFFHFDYIIVTLVKINYLNMFGFRRWVSFLLIIVMIDSPHHFDQT